MDELTFDGKTYVSSKRAAQITGYAKDYIGQLCREGRVEARLVGRNWYVLETSIREHRFGPDTSNQVKRTDGGSENNSDTEWESPTYVSETGAQFPPVFSEKASEAQNQAIDDTLTSSPIVREMHDAWQDWFSQKAVQKPVEEAAEADESAAESDNEAESDEEIPVQLHKTEEIEPEMPQKVEEEEEFIPITRVQEPTRSFEREPEVLETQEEEEIVPVRRTYIPPVTVLPPSHRAYEPRNTTAYAPEGRIIHERRIRKGKRKPSVVLSALFVALAVIAVAVAIIGSGKFTNFFSSTHTQYLPVQFLEGEKVISK